MSRDEILPLEMGATTSQQASENILKDLDVINRQHVAQDPKPENTARACPITGRKAAKENKCPMGSGKTEPEPPKVEVQQPQQQTLVSECPAKFGKEEGFNYLNMVCLYLHVV